MHITVEEATIKYTIVVERLGWVTYMVDCDARWKEDASGKAEGRKSTEEQ